MAWPPDFVMADHFLRQAQALHDRGDRGAFIAACRMLHIALGKPAVA